MKHKKRTFVIVYSILASCILALLAFFLIIQGEKATAYASKPLEDERLTVLIAGLDEAAENTDVLMLATLCQKGEMSVLQIPRDTYIKSDLYEGKINHLYRACIDKYGKKTGADMFLSTFSDAFGVPLDYYAVFTGQNLASLIDTVGGVTLSVPHSFEYTAADGANRTLKEGVQTLSGEEALAYVRFRAAYVEGDLGRLDAQMRFIAALTKQLLEQKSLRTCLRIYQKNYRNLLTNVTEKDIINIIQVYLVNRDNFDIRLMRLPGEACRGNEGAWYYVLNKKGTGEMLCSFFGGVSPSLFDTKKRFVREDRQSFSNIYGANNCEGRIYSLDEAAKAKVLHK